MADFKPTIEVRLEVPEYKRHPDHAVMAVDGYEVFHWPEFHALAFRLGIDISRPMKRLVLDLGEGRLPIALIEQTCADVLASRMKTAEASDEPMTLTR